MKGVVNFEMYFPDDVYEFEATNFINGNDASLTTIFESRFRPFYVHSKRWHKISELVHRDERIRPSLRNASQKSLVENNLHLWTTLSRELGHQGYC